MVIEDRSAEIWTANLDVEDVVVKMAESLVSEEELRRAERFHFSDGRRRFLTGRALLRALLGRYTGVSARELRLVVGDHGKPALEPSSTAPRCHFNLSHSQDRVVIAIAQSSPVGVDVERLRPAPHAEQIVRRFFSPGERAAYERLPRSLKLRAFFSLWARKEAFVKALGTGLRTPFRSFTVSIGEEDRPRLMLHSDEAAPAPGWNLFHLEPAADHVGALAARTDIDRIKVAPLDPEAAFRAALTD